MKNISLKNKLIIALLVSMFVVLLAVIFITTDDTPGYSQLPSIATSTPENPANPVDGVENEFISLVVYLQNKEVAAASDCGITYPEIITIPQTAAIADASLRYLFTDELAQYGEYQSVVVSDGVAKITLNNVSDPTGLWISSLSSCESRHLFSVLEDTLTQYQSITSVELYSASGKIEF